MEQLTDVEVIVSRHGATIQKLKEIAPKAVHLEHAEEKDILHKVVLGNLPIQLALKCDVYYAVILNVPRDFRGTEFTEDQLKQFGFEIKKLGIFEYMPKNPLHKIKDYEERRKAGRKMHQEYIAELESLSEDELRAKFKEGHLKVKKLQNQIMELSDQSQSLESDVNDMDSVAARASENEDKKFDYDWFIDYENSVY